MVNSVGRFSLAFFFWGGGGKDGYSLLSHRLSEFSNVRQMTVKNCAVKQWDTYANFDITMEYPPPKLINLDLLKYFTLLEILLLNVNYDLLLDNIVCGGDFGSVRATS